MKIQSMTLLLSVVALAAGDAPPLPYAAASYSGHDDAQSATGPYVQQYSHASEGFNIQSGFEGYLVPSTSTSQKGTILVPIQHGLEYLSSPTGLSRLVKYISAKGLRLIPKVILTVVGIAGLFLLGCAVTTAVCAFTPFCTISFLGWGVARENMRSFFTEDRISATAAFVSDAIKKYQEMYGNNPGKSHTENQMKI